MYRNKFNLRNVVAIAICLAVTTIFWGCEKENTNENGNETGINDSYYVKYVISCSYPTLFSNWSVTTPQGNYTKNGYQTRSWEQTYGTVKKGFICAVQVGNGEPTIEIYVSKNSEPFALKTTKTGHSASYTIDF
jgi:hypothetical protein